MAVLAPLWACGSASAKGSASSQPCPAKVPNVTSIVCVDGQHFRQMPRGFVGLSLEFDQIRDYIEFGPAKCSYQNAPFHRLNPAFLQLVENLGPQPVIRIGGDSSQDVTGVPGQVTDSCPRYTRQAPGATVSGYLGPNWYRAVGDFATQARANLILDLNQVHATNIKKVSRTWFPSVSEAHLLAGGFSPFQVVDHIVTYLEIGNEPEGSFYHKAPGYKKPYGGLYYSTFDYVRQTIANSDSLWGIPAPGVAGPVTGSVGSSSGLNELQYFLGREPVQMVAVHHYPLTGVDCPGGGDATVSGLLHAYNRGGKGYYFMQHYVPASVSAAGLRPGGVRVDELNSVTCQGKPGVSDSFASALWVLEATFRLAYKGVSGVNIHTQEDANNDPFQPAYGPGPVAAGHSTPGHMAVNPEYYGMYAFAQSAVAGSTLMGTSVCCYHNAPDKTNSLAVRAWAAQQSNGALSVAVLYNASGTRTVAVNVGPAYANREARLDCVSASSVSSRTATYDGQRFHPATGLVKSTPQAVGPGRRHLYDFTFTKPGIAILTVSGSTTSSGPSSGTC
jgi:hypothetical protein